MEFFIIRHGQTDYNKNGMVQGSGIDAPLNALGNEQADAFYRHYANEGFEKVYTSKLIRTRQSVARFIEDGLPVRALAGLDEISWGTQEGKPFTEESGRLYHEITTDWTNGKLDRVVAGGESPIDVMNRQKDAIEEIKQDGHAKVLVCMHGRAMRILFAWMLNYDLSKMDMFDHANLGLYRLTFTGSMYHIRTWNDTSHLNGLSSK